MNRMLNWCSNVIGRSRCSLAAVYASFQKDSRLNMKGLANLCRLGLIAVLVISLMPALPVAAADRTLPAVTASPSEQSGPARSASSLTMTDDALRRSSLVKTKRSLIEAETPQGQKWNPGTKQAFDEGSDRPPEECARATIKLVSNPDPELCGQFISASDLLEEKPKG